MAATILAQITTNLARAGEPTHLLIEASTIEGQHTGLLHDSLVSCNNLVTVRADADPQGDRLPSGDDDAEDRRLPESRTRSAATPT